MSMTAEVQILETLFLVQPREKAEAAGKIKKKEPLHEKARASFPRPLFL